MEIQKSSPILSIKTKLIACALFCFASCYLLQAEATSVDPFPDYQAVYQLHWYGVPVGKSTHRVQKMQENTYRVESVTVPSIPVPLQDFEKSEFITKNNLVQPSRYEFNTHDKHKKVEGALSFDWKQMRVEKSLKGEAAPTITPIPLHTHDKITQFFQLRRDLKLNKPLNYMVMEHKGLKPYNYQIVGKEKLKTPIGTLDTVVVQHISQNKKRRTVLWLAENLDYVMVKLIQVRDEKITAEALIQKFDKGK